jgi:hypothetical protein
VGAPTEVIVTRSAKVEVSSKSDFENKVWWDWMSCWVYLECIF